MNGSGVAGKASVVKDLLEENGYTITSIGNADSFDFERTVLRFKESFKKSGASGPTPVSPAGDEVGRPSWFSRIKPLRRYATGQWLGILVMFIVAAGIWKLAAGYGILPAADFPATTRDKWQAVFLVGTAG